METHSFQTYQFHPSYILKFNQIKNYKISSY